MVHKLYGQVLEIPEGVTFKRRKATEESFCQMETCGWHDAPYNEYYYEVNSVLLCTDCMCHHEQSGILDQVDRNNSLYNFYF